MIAQLKINKAIGTRPPLVVCIWIQFLVQLKQPKLVLPVGCQCTKIKMQQFPFLCHCFEVPDIPWPLAVAAKYDEPFSVSSIAGSAYHGRASDTWAVGVTLYCMITGRYPFLGETLQETYDKVHTYIPPFSS
jgi:serine/threonine protein kinase